MEDTGIPSPVTSLLLSPAWMVPYQTIGSALLWKDKAQKEGEELTPLFACLLLFEMVSVKWIMAG
jgi:hypothetical protein